MKVNIVNNNVSRKILELVCRMASIINPLIPKNENRILFYESSPGYMNNYTLMKFMVANGYDKKYRVYYFPDIRVEANLDSKKYSDIKFGNGLLSAFMLFLTSKYVFLDTGNMRMKPTNKQCVVYMDHGLPFKLDGLLIKGDGWATSVPKDLIMPVNYFISTSPNFDQMNIDTFDLSKQQLIRCGRPRTDALYSNRNYMDLVGIDKSKYEKVIIWMTTWRVAKNRRRHGKRAERPSDKTLPLLDDMRIISKLNEYLKKKNYFMVIKIHQTEMFDESSIDNLSNIKFMIDRDIVSKNIQIYDIVKDFDVLITDYSSVFLDFVITLKPMIFITDDIEDFSEMHGFYFDNPKGFMPGPKVNTFDELINSLDNIDQNDDDYKEKRIQLKDYCHYYQDGKDSSRLLSLLGIK